MKAYIIHGAYGHPKENWIPWLKSQLEILGVKTVVPDFPTPESQSLESWNKVFEPHIATLDSESILIGHSIGSGFILSILETITR